jgi:ATP-binding cassette subfamily C protein LapB
MNQQTRAEPSTIPLAAELLQRLLVQLEVSVDSALLRAACDKAAATLPEVQPVERVRFILTEAQLKGVQPIQLGWRRFDLRRLPALVLHQNAWFIAEWADTENIILTSADGSNQQLPEADLQDALVLWLRTPAQRSRASAPALKDNLAAALVWRELFRHRGWVAKVLVATLIVNVLAVTTSLFAMQVYDRVVPTLAYATFTTLVAGMMLIISLDWLLKTLRARIVDSVASSVDKRISQQVFEHLLH